ncbi:MAG TPA: glycosyltransferase family 39 protein [Terriglobia bacterium]|nr:glycosyltransferase family 39 protein [Terriglobia bacterium]
MSDRGANATELAPESGHLPVRAGASVAVALILVTAGSLYYFYSRGLTNLYGDGLAHVEGARRLFDSRTPGYAEIGSTWLPLFHILASPLAQNAFLWKTGLAGSLISAAAFVVAAWFLFRLSWEMNRNAAAAALSLAAFVLCPSMLFLAGVPLTEPLALMWAVLTVYALYRYQQSGRIYPLIGAAVAAFFGTLTRYDGWFFLPFATGFVFLARHDDWRIRFRNAIIFSSIAGAGPLFWFAHNAYRFGNPFDFYNGPHSAKAIYAHQLAMTAFRYPTDGSLLISARYFLADQMLVIGVWPLELAILGLMVWILDARQRPARASALLFLVPFVFYVQSMAHSAVPIYVPTLFPFTYYNLRYGIEMLPAITLFPSFVLSSRLSQRSRKVLLSVFLGLLIFQSIDLVSNGVTNLAVVQESIQNNPCRSKRQQALVTYFRDHYDGKTIMVASGKWPCLMPTLGIPFVKTLSEPNVKSWNQLSRSIPQEVEWIIRGEDDSVDELMRAFPDSFGDFALEEKEPFAGEGSVEVYRRRTH